MLSDRSQNDRRSLTNRSALTNGTVLLHGVDGRSAQARRFRDLVIAFADDLGGGDKLKEQEKAIVRTAAALTLRSEALQAAIINGEPIDENQAIRLANAAARAMQVLRRRTKAKALTGVNNGADASSPRGRSGGDGGANVAGSGGDRIDRRRREWRRRSELVRAYTKQLGGRGAVDDLLAARIASAAELRTLAEAARTRLLAGNGDLDEVSRLESQAARAEKALGLPVRETEPGPVEDPAGDRLTTILNRRKVAS
jgi:hypothetical protein